jgi:hypothetical protein
MDNGIYKLDRQTEELYFRRSDPENGGHFWREIEKLNE